MSNERGFELVPATTAPAPATPETQSPGPDRYLGFIESNRDGYTARLFHGTSISPVQTYRSKTFDEAKEWLGRQVPGRVLAPLSPRHPDTPRAAPAPPGADPGEKKPAPAPHQSHRAGKPESQSKAVDERPAPEVRARADEPVEKAPPGTSDQKEQGTLDDRNRITTLGELGDFLHEKADRDVENFKAGLGRGVEDGSSVLVATALASGADLLGLAFKGSTGWMRLGADLGQGGRWAPLKEVGNLLSFPGAGAAGELVGAGLGAAGRGVLTQAERGVARAGEAIEEVVTGAAAGASRLGPRLATEGAHAGALPALAKEAGMVERSTDQLMRATVGTGRAGTVARSHSFGNLMTKEQQTVREIEKALESTNTWHYEGLKRAFRGKVPSEMEAHHLALAQLFRNGPAKYRFLENYVPTVPLSEADHLMVHQGVTVGKNAYRGINEVLANYWRRSLSEPELKQAVAVCARYYDKLGAHEWASSIRKVAAIAFRG